MFKWIAGTQGQVGVGQGSGLVSQCSVPGGPYKH